MIGLTSKLVVDIKSVTCLAVLSSELWGTQAQIGLAQCWLLAESTVFARVGRAGSLCIEMYSVFDTFCQNSNILYGPNSENADLF